MFTPPPNTITLETKEFYISFNTRDYFTYGAITTALVIGEQMDIFYILEGDHRAEYKAIGDNLEKCIEYFQANSDKISKFSDRVGEPTAAELIREDLKKKGY
jgi:hypothetical protein